MTPAEGQKVFGHRSPGGLACRRALAL